MTVIARSVTLYVCPKCGLTKMDAAQMPAHHRDCGGEFGPVEYAPVNQPPGAVERAEKAEAEVEALKARVKHLTAEVDYLVNG